MMLIFSMLACDKAAVRSCEGNAGAPSMAPNSRISSVLVSNIWMIEYYVSSTDFEGGKSNRGRWFKFKADGTFTSGYWEEETCGGSWYLNESGQDPIIVIDSFNDAEDAAWQIQGIPEEPAPTDMSWVGAQDYPNYGDLVKMFNMLTPPTKEQFREK